MKAESETCPDEKTPYERFEDLAKSVFTVPKKEIDKKLAEYEKGKPHTRGRKRKPKTPPS